MSPVGDQILRHMRLGTLPIQITEGISLTTNESLTRVFISILTSHLWKSVLCFQAILYINSAAKQLLYILAIPTHRIAVLTNWDARSGRLLLYKKTWNSTVVSQICGNFARINTYKLAYSGQCVQPWNDCFL